MIVCSLLYDKEKKMTIAYIGLYVFCVLSIIFFNYNASPRQDKKFNGL